MAEPLDTAADVDEDGVEDAAADAAPKSAGGGGGLLGRLFGKAGAESRNEVLKEREAKQAASDQKKSDEGTHGGRALCLRRHLLLERVLARPTERW
jgi:hypothetical protein